MSQRVRRIETDSPAEPVPLRPAPEAAVRPAEALHAALLQELAALERATATDPFSNPIQRLAVELLRRLDGGTLRQEDLAQLIQRLTVAAFVGRAERLGHALGEGDPAANRARLRTLLRRLAVPEEARPPVPFARFQERVGRELFGIVITAHPTFAQPAALMRLQAELAVGRDGDGAPLDEAKRAAHVAAALAAEHRPDPALSLAVEHALSVEVIANIQAALRQVYDEVFAVAQEVYPEDWAKLTPRLLTIASWVGYDLDGRSDIKWSDSFLKRLILEARQLSHYREAVQAVRARFVGGGEIDLAHTLELLEARLALAAREVAGEAEAFGAIAADAQHRTEQLRAMSRRMYEELPQRLIGTGHVIELIEHAIAAVAAPEAKRALCILRAEIAGCGLGMAHTHVRINATQLHNAIRKAIGMETAADDPSRRRSYVAAVTQLIAAAEPVQVNFGSVLAERASAKRLMMLVAQMLKYVDASTPVRFLVAECETSLTLLTALYYAKLFGVADRLDISPLFETTKAFERATRVIDECLQIPEYAAYLRRRGRLCIQTGFSDAGRHLGQTTASAAIERLRLRIADLMVERGFADLELVMFNTHGEAIGRGAHPGSFADRLNYIMSPASRRRFAERGIRCKEEVSFQGGDGYLYFITPPIALATVARVLEFALGEPEDAADDPYYHDADYVSEFFIAIQKFNERLMGDGNYAALLDSFGINFLHPAGSRSLRREHDGAARVDLAHPSQLRAIPHNSILQQMGMLSNVVGGAGQAIANDPEKFQRFYRDSPRFRRLFAMVEWALDCSDPALLSAYIDLFDPGFWLSQLAHAEDPARAEEVRHAAEHLEELRRHERLGRVYRLLLRDLLALKAQLAACRAAAPAPAPLVEGIGEEARRNLLLLHAIRIALIQRLYLLAAHIPGFSDQHGITREELIAQVLHLEIEPVLRLLARIFPVTDNADLGGDFGEPSTYQSEANQSYAQEHARIFQPMARLYEMVRACSAGISHTVGAHG